MSGVRPTRADALLAVAVFCLVAAAVVTDGGPVGRAVLAYAFAAGFAALLLVSRRWPVAVLVVTGVGLVAYYVVDLPAIGLAVPLAAALYAAAELGRILAAASVAGVLLAVSVTARLAEGDAVSYVLGLSLGSEAVLMIAVITLGDAVRSRRALQVEMDRRAAAAAAERRREAARQVDIERIRIARELHDTLGHTMSVITLHAAVAEEAIEDGSPAAAGGAVRAIREAAGGAMSELRATIGAWLGGPTTREPAPGVDQLDALVAGVTRSGLPVELRIDGDVGSIPAVVGTTAYRLVQEALTNTLKHAGATRVDVTLHACETVLAVRVRDDGRGAASAAPAGHGLRGMTERVSLLGGTVHAGNAETGGFEVRARLPLRRSAA